MELVGLTFLLEMARKKKQSKKKWMEMNTKTDLLWGPQTERTHFLKLFKFKWEFMVYGVLQLCDYSHERVCGNIRDSGLPGKPENQFVWVVVQSCYSSSKHKSGNLSICCLWPKDKAWKSTVPCFISDLHGSQRKPMRIGLRVFYLTFPHPDVDHCLLVSQNTESFNNILSQPSHWVMVTD